MTSFSLNWHTAPAASILLLLLIDTEIVVSNAFSTSVDTLDALHPHSSPQNSIIFPIKSLSPSSSTIIIGSDSEAASEIAIGNSLSSAFDKLVGSSNFLVSSSDSSQGHKLSSCRVPAFGDDATVTFSPRTSTFDEDNNPTEYEMFAFDFDHPLPDFGMLCVELHKNREKFQNVVAIDDLKENVVDYLNSQQTPDPGMDADLTSFEAIGNVKLGVLLDDIIDEESLTKLQRDGYVTIDDVMKTTQSSNEKVDQWTSMERAYQSHCRTDTVSFLDRENALECGLEDQYDFLLTLASHLNDNLDVDKSPYKPIFPGTRDRPLTNPSTRNVQIAEYGLGDYYMSHSDNSIDMKCADHGVFEGISKTYTEDDGMMPKRRSNWRYITAILYLNEGWKVSDGGQLRMYLNTAFVENVKSCDGDTQMPYIDINPSNGKLLLFDSRMIHSVEEVVSESKVRRALTLWIRRPEKSGIIDESFSVDEEEEDCVIKD